MCDDRRLIVLYDGGCPLCSREIGHYRRLQALVPIEWIDLTREPERLQAFGVAVDDATAEFHVLDSSGLRYKGADAFVMLWGVLPYYRVLAWLCRTLPVLPLLRRIYRRFARWHYRRRCSANMCSGPSA